MNATSIKSQITKHIKKSMNSTNPKLSYWYCGITNNELRRRAEHKNKRNLVDFWKCYDAETMTTANEIEYYFSAKGTKNAHHSGGANATSRYVYIFKLNTASKRVYGLGGVVLSEEEVLKKLFS